MKRNYFILCFGRHSDLLNLSKDIYESINLPTKNKYIFTDRDNVDGVDVREYCATSSRFMHVLKRIIFAKNGVVHCVAPSLQNLILSMLAKTFGLRVFYNLHRFDYDSYLFPKNWILYIYNFLVFLISDKVFVHSKKIEKFLFWNKKIKFVPLPIHSDLKNKVDPEVFGDYVLFFGRIDSNKGLDFLNELIRNDRVNRYKIYGELVDNNLNELLKEINTHNNAVVSQRRVKTQELPNLFQNAKIVIIPYKNGTQSGIPALAKTLNTPILISDVGDLAENVSDPDFGLSLKGFDKDIWLNAINEIDWNTKRKNISKKTPNETTAIYNDELNRLKLNT